MQKLEQILKVYLLSKQKILKNIYYPGFRSEIMAKLVKFHNLAKNLYEYLLEFFTIIFVML